MVAERVVLDPLFGITIAFAGRLIRRDADTCSKTRSAGQRGDLENSGMDAWHGGAPRHGYGTIRSADTWITLIGQSFTLRIQLARRILNTASSARPAVGEHAASHGDRLLKRPVLRLAWGTVWQEGVSSCRSWGYPN